VTGDVLIDFRPRLIHDLYMPPEYYAPLIAGLRGVTEDETGTATEQFEDFPAWFTVLGKTGTIEVGGKQDNAAFAAFGPWPNPQYAAVTYIEEAGLGGEAAAPVVAAVFEAIARGDIDVVPTEAEIGDQLLSEAEAEAVEEERLRSESELAALEAAAAEGESDDDFVVLVPESSAPAASDPASGVPEPGEGNPVLSEPDVLVLRPDDEEGEG